MSLEPFLRPMPTWALALCGALLLFSIIGPIFPVRRLIPLIQWRTGRTGDAAGLKPFRNLVAALFVRQVIGALAMVAFGLAVGLGRSVPIAVGFAIGLLALSVLKKMGQASAAGDQLADM